MIYDRQIENESNNVLLTFFERALGDLGLVDWMALLHTGNVEQFRARIKPHAYSALAFDVWVQKRERILNEPGAFLNWEPLGEPEEEIWGHYRLQSAIVATLLGDEIELRTLAAQLVTEPINRKLVISYFLGHLTGGKIGLRYKEIPTKEQINSWIRDINEIELSDKIQDWAVVSID